MSFSQLPDELIFMICEKLTSVVDLVNLSVCSKRTSLLCKDINFSDFYTIETKYENSDVIEEFVSLKINSILSFNKNIKLKLDLSESNITNVSNLVNLYELNLSNCDDISDVSKLGNLHTLDLSGCKI
jgi:hypothetical protein